MRIKHLHTFFIAIIFLASCNTNSQRFVIIGNITGMPVQNVVLEQINANDVITILDSTESDNEGHFEFTESSTEPGLYRLHFKSQKFILLSIDKGNMKVIGDWSNLTNYNILGSQPSESLKNLLAAYRGKVRDFNSLYIAIDTLKQRGNDSILALARKDLDELKLNFTRYIENYADTTPYLPNAIFAARILNPANEGQFLDMFAKNIITKFPGTKLAKDFSDYYIKVSTKAYQAKEKVIINIGDMAPEINLASTSGNYVSLHSLKGKVVFVDFWASFCPPCREENPKMVAAFKKYKNRNFVVYGVSLDDNKTAWEEAIKTDNLDWTQVSDLKKWESPAAKVFGVTSIPTNFLIDTAGKVIAKNIHGDELIRTLDNVLQ